MNAAQTTSSRPNDIQSQRLRLLLIAPDPCSFRRHSIAAKDVCNRAAGVVRRGTGRMRKSSLMVICRGRANPCAKALAARSGRLVHIRLAALSSAYDKLSQTRVLAGIERN